MKALFVAGTDTEVGKTMVCGCLAKFLASQGFKVGVQKWVSTGDEGSSKDIEFSLKMLGKEKEGLANLELICPYVLTFASSPHLAAELEGKQIDVQRIKESFYKLSGSYEILIVEGIGGIMVPLRRDYLLVDLLKDLSLPVLIVARSALGTINHSLLTIEALRTRGIEILGVVFNSLPEEDDIIVKDNMKVIGHLGNVQVLGLLPKLDQNEKIYKAFRPIGERILQKIRRNT